MTQLKAFVVLLLGACVLALTPVEEGIYKQFHATIALDVAADEAIEVNGHSMTFSEYQKRTMGEEKFGESISIELDGSKKAKCEVGGTTGIYEMDQLYQGSTSAYAWDVSPCKQDAKSCPGEKVFIRQMFSGNHSCNNQLMDCTGKPTQILYAAKSKTYKMLFRQCSKAINVGERVSILTVKCGKKGLKATDKQVSVTIDSAQTLFYNFNMEGACGSFDFGWVFVILVLVGFFLYFLIGFLINMFVRGLRGIEAVPNLAFWKDLPYLIKDGFFFVFRCFGRAGFQKL